MDLHAEIMNIQIDRVRMVDQLNLVSDYNTAYKLGHKDARHVAAELALKAQARIEELESKLRREEEEHGNTINQRDQAEAYADMLSLAVGEHFRVDVGEHSNMNCPWFEAEKILNGEYTTDSDEEREISRLKVENEKYNQRYLIDLDLFGKCQERENFQELRIKQLEYLLEEVLKDSGFTCLFDELQSKIQEAL